MIRSGRIAITCLAAALFLPPAAVAQQCLHGADASAEQKGRKRAALSVARQINTLQANAPGRREKNYLDRAGLAVEAARQAEKNPGANMLSFDAGAEVIPGWELSLDKTETGYWFMIKDQTDPCGFAYVSNQTGVIYTAEPIR